MVEKLKNKAITLLRWSEKYTKTDMVYLAEGGFWTTLGQFSLALSVFIGSILFARFVNPQVYGMYKYLLSVSAVISSFLLVGLSVGATKYASQGYSKVLPQVFKENLKWSWPAILIAISASIYYFTQGNTVLSAGLLAIAIFTPLTYSAASYGSFLIGVKDFRSLVLANSMVAYGNVAVIATAIFLTENPLIIFTSYLISNLLFNFIGYTIVKRKYVLDNNEVPRKELLEYGAHNTVINLLPNLANQADKIFIFTQLGAVDLAIYSFAVAIPDQIKALFKNISRIAFPKFATRTIDEIKSNLWSRIGIFILLALVISGIYIPLAPFIYRFLFPVYTESIKYSQILAIFIFTSVVSIPLSILQSHSKYEAMYTNTIISSVIQIALNYFLIHYYGIMGAIIATIITRLISMLVGFVTVGSVKGDGLPKQI